MALLACFWETALPLRIEQKEVFMSMVFRSWCWGRYLTFLRLWLSLRILYTGRAPVWLCEQDSVWNAEELARLAPTRYRVGSFGPRQCLWVPKGEQRQICRWITTPTGFFDLRFWMEDRNACLSLLLFGDEICPPRRRSRKE